MDKQEWLGKIALNLAGCTDSWHSCGTGSEKLGKKKGWSLPFAPPRPQKPVNDNVKAPQSAPRDAQFVSNAGGKSSNVSLPHSNLEAGKVGDVQSCIEVLEGESAIKSMDACTQAQQDESVKQQIESRPVWMCMPHMNSFREISN